MMEKLMIDSLVTWAERVQDRRLPLRPDGPSHEAQYAQCAQLDALPWQDGVDRPTSTSTAKAGTSARWPTTPAVVNATQLNLGGTGIGTFSDRLRDAVRGGGPFDGGEDLVRRQGFANGLYYDPNALNSGAQSELDTLLLLTRPDPRRHGRQPG